MRLRPLSVLVVTILGSFALFVFLGGPDLGLGASTPAVAVETMEPSDPHRRVDALRDPVPIERVAVSAPSVDENRSSLSAIVKSSTAAVPLEGVLFEIRRFGREAQEYRSNARGEVGPIFFALDVAEQLEITVDAGREWKTEHATIELNPGADVARAFVLQPASDSTVRTLDSSGPLGGVRIHALDEQGVTVWTGQTGADGRVTVPRLDLPGQRRGHLAGGVHTDRVLPGRRFTSGRHGTPDHSRGVGHAGGLGSRRGSSAR